MKHMWFFMVTVVLAVPLHHQRWILVHNAYKQLPPLQDPALDKVWAYQSWDNYIANLWSFMPYMVRLLGLMFIQGIEYEHPPIETYLNQGLRAFELDIYYDDPEHPHWTSILNVSQCKHRCDQRIPLRDPQWFEKGMKVFHMQDLDMQAEYHTLRGYLFSLKRWSDRNPTHDPILIVLESKDSSETLDLLQQYLPLRFLSYLPFPDNYTFILDRDLFTVFSHSSLFTPDDLKTWCNTTCLNEAVRTCGWPNVTDLRGKFLFSFSNTKDIQTRLYIGKECLKGRAMFPLDALPYKGNHRDASAIFKLDSPDHPRLNTLATQGYLVITRADADTKQARRLHWERRNQALQSAAQYISTDYPNPPSHSSPLNTKYNHFGLLYPNFDLTYRVTFPNKSWRWCNHHFSDTCTPPPFHPLPRVPQFSNHHRWVWTLVIFGTWGLVYFCFKLDEVVSGA